MIAQNISINKQQIEIIPAFTFTKYKIYETTFATVILDLQ